MLSYISVTQVFIELMLSGFRAYCNVLYKVNYRHAQYFKPDKYNLFDIVVVVSLFVCLTISILRINSIYGEKI